MTRNKINLLLGLGVLIIVLTWTFCRSGRQILTENENEIAEIFDESANLKELIFEKPLQQLAAVANLDKNQRINLNKEEIQKELRRFENLSERQEALAKILMMNAASVQVLAALAKNTSDPVEKIRAIEILQKLDFSNFPQVKADTTQALLAIISSGDSIQIRDAVRALGNAGNTDSARVLQSFLGHENAELNVIAIDSLSKVSKSVSDPSFKSAVSEFISRHWLAARNREDGAGESIAAASARALGVIGSESSAKFLAEQLGRSHDMNTKLDIVRSLGFIGSPLALPALQNYHEILLELLNLPGSAEKAQLQDAIKTTEQAISSLQN